MDADLVKRHKTTGKELVLYPDADESDPGTESESETEIVNVQNSSTDTSADDEDIPLAQWQQNAEDMEEDIPLAQIAPHLRPIRFQWEKRDAPIDNTEFRLQFSDPPEPKWLPIQYFNTFSLTSYIRTHQSEYFV